MVTRLVVNTRNFNSGYADAEQNVTNGRSVAQLAQSVGHFLSGRLDAVHREGADILKGILMEGQIRTWLALEQAAPRSDNEGS